LYILENASSREKFINPPVVTNTVVAYDLPNNIIVQKGSARKFLDQVGDKDIILTSKSQKIHVSECKNVYIVKNNNDSIVDELSLSVKGFSQIIALGSGTVMDIAKYLGKSHSINLVAIPTALTCNASVTDKSVLRINGKIQTISSKAPDKVIIDEDLIKKAERRYNMSGIADVISTYTALYDWDLSVKKQIDNDDLVVRSMAESILSTALQQFNNIIGNEINVKALWNLLFCAGAITNMYGSGRPESGSEHMFARAVEELPSIEIVQQSDILQNIIQQLPSEGSIEHIISMN